MAKPEISTKRLAIVRANAQMVGVVGAAAFVSIFCLVASKAVFSQNRYQARVTSAAEKAHQQLLQNIQAAGSLTNSFKTFDSQTTNIIGGSSTGTGNNDGDNAKIILDALPSSYDFPALTSTIEKILTDRNFTIGNITGTDDQVNQQNNTSSPNPQPVQMPFSFTVSNANYTAVQQLIDTLQASIRPIAIDSITMSGGVNDMSLTVDAHTYYQPAKSLTVTTKAVK
jgi:hypothetical protein